MSWYNWIFLSLATSITLFIQICTYAAITSSKFKKSVLNIFFILIGGIIITYNTYSNPGVFRAYVSLSILLTIELLIFRHGIRKTIINGAVTYIIATFFEVFFDIILIVSNIINLESIDKNVFLKILISILIVIVPYFIVINKRIKKVIQSFIKLLEKTIIPLIILSIFLISSLIIAFKNISNLSTTNYISNVILFLFFSILIFVILYNEHKAEKEVEKTKILLEFMANYEKKIDEDRINRHEMLNNLLILKSYRNKNSKDYNDILDEFIEIYNKKNSGIKNIYKLPSGLKGIIYYKINEIKNKNMVININISKQLSNSLQSLNHKTYAALCKIVGITFDNAIEATIKSKEKYINFDVYENDNRIVIEIENTYSGKIDLKKINDKYYSTKGKNRGLGLYIVNSLIKDNPDLDLKQKLVKNIFITEIYINKI